MTQYLNGIFLLMFALFSSAIVLAHPATERYIPIGKSPGRPNAGVEISTGSIKTINNKQKSITMIKNANSYTVVFNKKTKIWLDRSKIKLTNLVGSYSSLKPGDYIEVKFSKSKKLNIAIWVKVETK